MKTRPLVLGLIAAAVLAAAAVGAYTFGVQRGRSLGSSSATSGGTSSMATPSASTTAAPAASPNETGEDATRRHIAAGLKAGDTVLFSGDVTQVRAKNPWADRTYEREGVKYDHRCVVVNVTGSAGKRAR